MHNLAIALHKKGITVTGSDDEIVYPAKSNLQLNGIGSLEVVASGDPDAGAGDWVVADAGRGALYVARAGDAAHPSRILEAGFNAGGARVLSTDRIAIAGLVVLDPAASLARAVPLALSRPALERSELTAVYVD